MLHSFSAGLFVVGAVGHVGAAAHRHFGHVVVEGVSVVVVVVVLVVDVVVFGGRIAVSRR